MPNNINRHIQASDIILTIKNLKNSGAVGIDSMPIWIIKDNVDILYEPIRHTVQYSINTLEELPEQWRVQLITPVGKVSNPKNLKDFRPIAINTCIARIAESVVCNWLQEFYDVINNCQYGYRKNLGCLDALCLALHNWTAMLDNCNPVHIIFMDYSKAFDLVDHDQLIEKLIDFNVDTKTLLFIERFLKRKQHVRINDQLSNSVAVTSGVPQGSKIGPMCFNFYSDSMISCIADEETKIIRYADDTTIYGPNIIDLQNTIDKIGVWSANNNLKLNETKTQNMNIKIRSNSDSDNVEFKLNEHALEKTHIYKFLGILIDDKLLFNEHVQYILKRAKMKFYYILKAKKSGIQTKDLLSLYGTLILPIIDYAAAAWGTLCSTKNINEIETFEKRCMRIILGVYHSSDIPDTHLNNLFTNRAKISRKNY